MHAELQRVMEAILSEIPCADAFIDNNLAISKSYKIKHIGLVEKILRKLDKKTYR